MEELFDISKPVSFRLPQDTAQPVLEYLNELKQQEGRKYSSVCASLFVSAINEQMLSNNSGERLTIHLPGSLTPEQREWLASPMTKQMLGQWIFQMMNDPGKPVHITGVENTPVPDTAQVNEFKIENSTTSNLAKHLLYDDED